MPPLCVLRFRFPLVIKLCLNPLEVYTALQMGLQTDPGAQLLVPKPHSSGHFCSKAGKSPVPGHLGMPGQQGLCTCKRARCTVHH